MKQPWNPDPLYVEPEPVRRACPGCGRIVRSGRCPDCIGRGGNAVGLVALAFLAAVITCVVILAASRPGSAFSPTPAQTEASRSGELSASPTAADTTRPWTSGSIPAPAHGASSGEETPRTTGMRPASDGAAAAASPPAATPVYRGTATWFCGNGSPCTAGYEPSDLIAAIDRKDAEFRKGDRVVVRYGDRAVIVTIVDTCACPDRRVIDLSTGAFRRLAPLAQGVIPVTLELADAIRLPETDTDWRDEHGETTDKEDVA